MRQSAGKIVNASLVFALVGSVFASTSFAAPPAKPAPAKKAAEPAVALSAGLKDKLKGNDTAAIASAFDELRTAGKAGAAYANDVAAILDRGTTVDLTVGALDTLGDLQVEATNGSISPYARHRDEKVRRAAIKALAKVKGEKAQGALRRALSDPDPQVRGFAASGLGGLKAHDALPDLFIALDHRVGEAAASIGQLCVPAECGQFADRLGRQPLDIMTGGFDQILFRPANEIDDDTKIKMIGKLRELGTKEVNAFLRDVQKRWPAKGSARVKQSLDQAVAATGGSSSITVDSGDSK